jgi:hypothetical protein
MGSTKMPATFRMTSVALVAGIAAIGQLGSQARAAGSSQVPRYTPQSPTVSPYLSLLSRNGSVAGNYYTLVRPLQRQQHINERNSLQNYTQQQELQKLQEQQLSDAFKQPKVKPTGTAGWFQDLGPNSPYQQSDHYYGQWQTGPGHGRTPARRR